MIKFGTGGWRAIIADQFTFENVRRVAKGLSILIKNNRETVKPVVIGHDLRFLSGRFSRAFAEVLVVENIPVLFIENAIPTPMLMYAVEQEELNFGIMITASHNTPEYNGIKLIIKGGKDAPVEITNKLEGFINSISDKEIKHGYFFDYIKEQKIKYYCNKNDYIDSLLEQVDIESIKKKNLKVLFNPMFGVSKDIMGMCLASLRCSVDLINGYRDTMFGNRMPAPMKENLQDMEYRMKSGEYDLGIATDGDSDRIGLYDEKGNYVDANQILKLLYYYLKEYKKLKGGVVRNLTTTHILDRIAKEYNEPFYEVPVGFKYISMKMEEQDLLLGGESSGGLKIRGHVNGKDGILAAILSVEMIAKTNKSIRELLKEIDHRYGKRLFQSLNLPYHSTERSRLQHILFKEKYIPKFSKEIKDISYIDGVKCYFRNGTWLSIRFSGTEPVLRIFMEMNDQIEVKDSIDTILTDERLSLSEII